jgi:hypothetical protein
LGGNNNTGDSGFNRIGDGLGGAIATRLFGTSTSLTVAGCTFMNNRAVGGTGNMGGVITGDGVGGGLANFGGALGTLVSDCVFSGSSATGGAGGAGQNGGDGWGGAIGNIEGSSLTVSSCTLSGNQASGGEGGSGANGGNGFGGGIFNDGLSTDPANSGTPAILTVTGSSITDNQAGGGAAGSGGTAGQGVGGGLYLSPGGSACLDVVTIVRHNHASTSDDDVFGTFATCP